jgi:hypothetical protein
MAVYDQCPECKNEQLLWLQENGKARAACKCGWKSAWFPLEEPVAEKPQEQMPDYIEPFREINRKMLASMMTPERAMEIMDLTRMIHEAVSPRGANVLIVVLTLASMMETLLAFALDKKEEPK